MRRFLIRRLVAGIVVVVLVSLFVFSMSRLAGDPRLLYADGYMSKAGYDALGKKAGPGQALLRPVRDLDE